MLYKNDQPLLSFTFSSQNHIRYVYSPKWMATNHSPKTSITQTLSGDMCIASFTMLQFPLLCLEINAMIEDSISFETIFDRVDTHTRLGRAFKSEPPL